MRKGVKKFLCVLCSVSLGIPVMFSASSLTASAAANSYSWNHAQIYGGGYVVNIIFNKGEKNLIYARTDMGGAYRWNQDAKSWVPLTDSIGFNDWNNLGCDSLAADPVDTNRVYIQAGTYTNSWTSANGCILRSTDKGNTWEKTKLPFKVGANMQGRYFGERLVVDPNSDNVLYMGTRCGNGLWKSTDYGVTWSKVSTFTEVGDYKPTDDDSTMYDSDYTGVVWVTPDASSSKSGTPCQTLFVGVVNKKGENTVFVTKNGGTTWNPVTNQPTYSVVPEKNNSAVTKGLFPTHGVLASNGVLYITYNDTVNVYSGDKGDVWKYDTATGDWTQISPVASSSSDDYFGYGGISVDEQNPNTLVVSTDEQWWPDANIYRSTDGGRTWTSFWSWNGYPDKTLRYTQDISAAGWLTMGKQAQAPESQVKIGWMIGNISIDPFDSDRMMYGTGATVYGTENLTDLDQGGKVKLSVYAKGIEQTAVTSLISPTTGTAHLISGLGDLCGFVHTDLNTVPLSMMTSPTFSTTTGMDYAELNPSKYVRVGNTDKGTYSRIAISNDTGANWYSVSNCWTSSSEDTTCGGKVAMSADGKTIVWAPEGQNSAFPVKYSANDGNSWNECRGIPKGATVASDRVDPKKFYGYSDGKFYVSTDSGMTFTAAVSSGLPNPSASTSPETTPVSFKAMPGSEGDIWLAGGSEAGEYGLYHSADSGQSFTRLKNVDQCDVVGFGKAARGKSYMSLYVSAKINGIRGIFRSDDAGVSWVRINDDQHQYGKTNMCITGDPRIYGRVYLGTNGRGIVYGDIGEAIVTDSAISPTTVAFDKANASDVSVVMTQRGNTLVSIRNGTAILDSKTDYTVSGSNVTVSKDYLSKQSAGETVLTFCFSAGQDQTLSVEISDSSVKDAELSAATASFDKANASDIAVTMTLNGNSLSAIQNGTTVLTPGTDYTVSDSNVTISKSYLSRQSLGKTTFTFYFSAGQNQSLTVTVSDSSKQATFLKIVFYNSNRSTFPQSISPWFRITNQGNEAVNLSKVKLRYYYTKDNTKPQNFYCNWSTAGSSNVTGTFVPMTVAKTNADTYLEVGFTSAAGSLAAGQSTDVQIQFAKTDWSSYDQSNDYSFNSDADSYSDWNKVTGYFSGSLFYGIEL